MKKLFFGLLVLSINVAHAQNGCPDLSQYSSLEKLHEKYNLQFKVKKDILVPSSYNDTLKIERISDRDDWDKYLEINAIFESTSSKDRVFKKGTILRVSQDIGALEDTSFYSESTSTFHRNIFIPLDSSSILYLRMHTFRNINLMESEFLELHCEKIQTELEVISSNAKEELKNINNSDRILIKDSIDDLDLPVKTRATKDA